MPPTREEFDELKKQVDRLTTADGVAEIEQLIFVNDLEASGSSVYQTTSVPALGGDVDHLKQPPRLLVVRHKSELGLLAWWPLSDSV